MIKLKVNHIATKQKRRIRKVYSTLHTLREAGVMASKEELDIYMKILGNVELCRQIKLNLPRTARMQKWLDKKLSPTK